MLQSYYPPILLYFIYFICHHLFKLQLKPESQEAHSLFHVDQHSGQKEQPEGRGMHLERQAGDIQSRQIIYGGSATTAM